MVDTFAALQSRIVRLRTEHLEPALYSALLPLQTAAWEVAGEPVPAELALRQLYQPFEPGTRWGKPWGTTWLHVTGRVPSTWGTQPGTGHASERGLVDLELIVDLGFTRTAPGFQAEGLVFDSRGHILKALEPRNSTVPLALQPGDAVDLYIEAASNPDLHRDGDFSPTPLGDVRTAGCEPLYTYGGAHVGVLNRQVWELLRDLDVVVGLAALLTATSTRRACIEVALGRMLDALDPDDVGATAGAARAELTEVLAAPAHHSAHQIVATGHAHIDSAWLWPVRETIRKCARTFSNMVDLLDREPDFVFACSSAQQYAWVKENYPELYQRIKAHVAAGRFVPVGGMWVESDTNMPGGEAMARQLIFGKRFFLEEFGLETQEVWLPDSFGYSAALPQIAVAAGNRWFLTQKISWNDTNVMPHHTFWWEGIDGSRIFTHFPPVDTYNSDLLPADLERAERQFSEKGKASVSLVPFGYGDGGGGPTREMVATAHRSHDLEGLARVTMGSPREFFTRAQAEYPQAPVWSGELYLELHRGVLTSQARTKRGNRRCEQLLHEAELWSATAAVRTGFPYPYAELEECWQRVLLAQFHDILPGSSIAWVYRDTEQAHAEVARTLEGIITGALAALTGHGEHQLNAAAAPLTVPGAQPMGITEPNLPIQPALACEQGEGVITIDNGLLRVSVDATTGLVTSLVDGATGRETIAAGMQAGLFQLHRDVPAKWDAWDIEDHYRRVSQDLTHADAVTVQADAQRAAVVVRREFSHSVIVQRIEVEAGSRWVDIDLDIEWHEARKLLKLAFPLALQADTCAAETQFGHVRRPTHTNTSWDEARFEVCAHRWVQVEEPGFGFAIANDSTYGHDVRRITAADGTAATQVRLSILRAPLYPDPQADQGSHHMRVRLVPGAGVLQAAQAGYDLNSPVRRLTGDHGTRPLVTLDEASGVVAETVKLADDASGDVVVRLYEARGAHGSAVLTTSFDWDTVTTVDLLERPLAAQVAQRRPGTGQVELDVRPFQLLTLRFTRPVTPGGRHIAESDAQHTLPNHCSSSTKE